MAQISGKGLRGQKHTETETSLSIYIYAHYNHTISAKTGMNQSILSVIWW